VEIERKFLIRELPDLEGLEHTRIEQGYLTLADAGAEVRLRRKGDEFLLTVKGGKGRERAEFEVGLTAEQFAELWPLTEGKRLVKTRVTAPLGILELELDLFGGDLDGLALAEVEFPDEARADSFEPPEWFGREVTGDDGYLNESLATEGRPGPREEV
jgi:CYTH domain-containing protein